jgi:hypothetical protein
VNRQSKILKIFNRVYSTFATLAPSICKRSTSLTVSTLDGLEWRDARLPVRREARGNQ